MELGPLLDPANRAQGKTLAGLGDKGHRAGGPETAMDRVGVVAGVAAGEGEEEMHFWCVGLLGIGPGPQPLPGGPDPLPRSLWAVDNPGPNARLPLTLCPDYLC